MRSKKVRFEGELHSSYIYNLASSLSSDDSYEGAMSSHLRMNGIYWSVAALSILEGMEEVQRYVRAEEGNSGSILSFVMECYDSERGGFSGNVGHDAHLLYTLSAVQILAMAGELSAIDKEKVVCYIASLQQVDGSFVGDAFSGEVDTRFTYCAVSALSILESLDAVDVEGAARYVLSCRNFDGGFGCVPGAESHAGQIFCCVGALSILQRLDHLDTELLAWWLCERQCDSGGLNGRPEKQADVCYSWWILSALSILGRLHYISMPNLTSFILQCQDKEDGGIADRPLNVADIFHTFFGISGLSLMEYFQTSNPNYRTIDPVYALPTDVVQTLHLKGQVISPNHGEIQPRLQIYQILPQQNSQS